MSQKLSFIKKMEQLQEDQVSKASSNSTIKENESSFYNQTTNGQKVLKISIKDQVFKKCIFMSSQIVSCQFLNCTFLQCDFSGTDLFNVKFMGSIFKKCDFSSCKMKDVDASDTTKMNCIFKNTTLEGNVKGFNIQDQNIITDQVDIQINDRQNVDTVYNNIKSCMEKYFNTWKQTQEYLFESTFDENNSCLIALYSAKNYTYETDNKTDIWKMQFYIGQQILFTKDINFYGLTQDQIQEEINNTIGQIQSKSQEIMNKIIVKLMGE